MDRADVVRAWECCIDTENGPCAEDCPMKDAEWKERGLAACRAFADDHVEVPLALIQRTVELLKAQEPKPVKHIHEEYPEHLWAKDEDGEIDEWAGEDRTSTHHGPVCERCGDSFCVGCEPNGYETHKKCVIDKYECPTCGRGLWRNQKYCDECGQAGKWE